MNVRHCKKKLRHSLQRGIVWTEEEKKIHHERGQVVEHRFFSNCLDNALSDQLVD